MRESHLAHQPDSSRHRKAVPHVAMQTRPEPWEHHPVCIPLQGWKLVTHTRDFNFSHVSIEILRRINYSHMGWMLCSLETGLKKRLSLCAISGNILEGANCTFQCVIPRGQDPLRIGLCGSIQNVC